MITEYVEESSSFTIENFRAIQTIQALCIKHQMPPHVLLGVYHFEIPGEWLSTALARYANTHKEKPDGQRSKTSCT